MKEIKIKSAKHINGYKLHLIFNDNKEQIINFKPFLEASSHPEIAKYLDKDIFKKFSLVDGDLMWGDFDLIFPVYDLYTNSILKLGKPAKAS